MRNGAIISACYLSLSGKRIQFEENHSSQGIKKEVVQGDTLRSSSPSAWTNKMPVLFVATTTYLREKITESPSNKGSESLCRQRMLVKGFVVGSPSRNSTSSYDGGVTEKRASSGSVLAEWR